MTQRTNQDFPAQPRLRDNYLPSGEQGVWEADLGRSRPATSPFNQKSRQQIGHWVHQPDTLARVGGWGGVEEGQAGAGVFQALFKSELRHYL